MQNCREALPLLQRVLWVWALRVQGLHKQAVRERCMQERAEVLRERNIRSLQEPQGRAV